MRYCPACHSVFPNEFRTCPKDQSALRAAAELQPGMVLRGKYEVQERLGAGGMAAVYRARHLAFDEVCAIKVVAGRLADDEDFLRRFRNEAVVARRFQHPNAVRVDDLDTTEDGRPFIVMEYVRGPNLREVVRKEGALGLRRALTLARQVASALAAAHDLGIVHRDIKPDNILLAGEGPAESAKVLDFGIAKVKEGFFGDGEAVATRTGAVVGTPQYISPEQALGRRGDELDGRADLYSLGVVLYEMVTGRLPFESDTAMGMILQHLQTPPPAPHEVRPDLGIPEELSAVLVRALDKDREKRFRSARDMIAAIDGVLALPLPERAAAAATPPPEPVPADIDRRETRVMPRTPSATGASTPPGAGSATRVQPATVHLPPLPGTPVTPPPRVTTPPPLPPVFTAPPPRRRRIPRWLKWVGIGIGAWVIFGPDGDDRPRRRASGPPASPAIAGAPAEDPEARDVRIEQEVERALKQSERTNDEAIYVDVEGAVVALTGHVHERAAAVEAGRLAAAVAGVAAVSNEIQLRAPGDHRATVPRAQAVPAVPPAGGVPAPMPVPVPMLDSALRMMAKEIPVAQLVNAGQRALEAGEPDKALEMFTAALSLDPTNREASEGAREAGRQIQRKHGHPSPPPRPPAPPPGERR